MCLILNSWFGKDLGDGVMLGSTLGILITVLKIILFSFFYLLTSEKHGFWDKGFHSVLTYFVYDLVILMAFVIIFIGGKRCSSALLVTGLICLLVGTVAQFLYLCLHVAWWISKGQQNDPVVKKDDKIFEDPFHPTIVATMIVTTLFILTSMYLVYLIYFILTVSSYIAQIGEVRVR